MKLSIALRQVLLVTAVALLAAACGGGADTSSVGDTGGLVSVRTAEPLAAAAPLTAAQLMDWAEVTYPQYFPASNKVDGFASPFTYRYYAATQNYLGVSTESGDV